MHSADRNTASGRVNVVIEHLVGQLCILDRSASTVQFRIVNAASVQGAVDVYASATGTTTGTPTASALAFQSASTYVSQGVGPIILKMTAPGTQNTVSAP